MFPLFKIKRAFVFFYTCFIHLLLSYKQVTLFFSPLRHVFYADRITLRVSGLPFPNGKFRIKKYFLGIVAKLWPIQSFDWFEILSSRFSFVRNLQLLGHVISKIWRQYLYHLIINASSTFFTLLSDQSVCSIPAYHMLGAASTFNILQHAYMIFRDTRSYVNYTGIEQRLKIPQNPILLDPAPMSLRVLV